MQKFAFLFLVVGSLPAGWVYAEPGKVDQYKPIFLECTAASGEATAAVRVLAVEKNDTPLWRLPNLNLLG